MNIYIYIYYIAPVQCCVKYSIILQKFTNNIRKTVVEDKQNTNLKRSFLSSILNFSSIRTLVDVNGPIY